MKELFQNVNAFSISFVVFVCTICVVLFAVAASIFGADSTNHMNCEEDEALIWVNKPSGGDTTEPMTRCIAIDNLVRGS